VVGSDRKQYTVTTGEQPLLEAKAPLVTVVIPCYNQARFLGEAIESVLSQSYRIFEVIVVDDGSTDNTSEVASSYEEVRLVRQENRGLSGARNTGIRHSQGEYLVFLDADDRLLPWALSTGLEHLDAHQDCAFVSGYCKVIASDGTPRGEWQHQPADEDPYIALLQKCYIPAHSAVIYRREVFHTVGGFDTSLKACEDYEHYLRVARRFPIHHHGEAIVECRRHDANMTRTSTLMLTETLKVLSSQREHVKNDERREEAYKLGVRYEQTHWGLPLVDGLRENICAREWNRAVEGILILLRYYPRGLALLSERRMERHKVARNLQNRREELRDYEQRLQQPGPALEEERRRVRWLRKRIRRLETQAQEIDQQAQFRLASGVRKLYEKVRRLGA
jgi:hypothetical protein